MASENVVANVIVEIPNVSCYYISNDKRKLLSSSNLSILLSAVEQVEVYLLVLDKFQTPASKSIIVIQTAKNEYLVPYNDCTYAIILPNDVDPDHLEILEGVFTDHCTFRRSQIVKRVEDFPIDEGLLGYFKKISPMDIENGANMLASGIASGAHYLGQGFHSASDFIIARVKPLEKEEVKNSSVGSFLVDPNTASKLHVAKTLSSSAVQVSKVLFMGVVAATKGLSDMVASSLADSEYGKKLKDANSPAQSHAKSLAVSALVGASVLLEAGARATVQLVGDAADGVVKVIGHKYGDDAAKTAKITGDIVKDASEASFQLAKCGPSAVVGRVASDATTTLLKGDDVINNSSSNNIRLENVNMMVNMAGKMLDVDNSSKKPSAPSYPKSSEQNNVGDSLD